MSVSGNPTIPWSTSSYRARRPLPVASTALRVYAAPPRRLRRTILMTPNGPVPSDPGLGDPFWQALLARDVESLGPLALLHPVTAFVFGAFSLCGLPRLTIGLAMMSGAIPAGRGEPTPALFGGLFALVGGVVALHIALSVACALASGWISRRERHGSVFVVDGLLLLWTPIGTALGIPRRLRAHPPEQAPRPRRIPLVKAGRA